MHILPTLGKTRLQEIQPAHLKQLYLLKQEEGRGARTVQLVHTVIHSILEQAVKEGIIGRNPADAVERPNATPKERQILTQEQIGRLFIAGRETRLGALIYLAIMTGMREGEMLGLKWSDLDWEKGQLDIKRQLQPQKGKGLVLVPPKTKAGTRKIGLGQATLEMLATHREKQGLLKQAMAEVWEENDLIFPNLHGKPWAQTKMLQEYKKLLHENGLPAITFHDLRHTSISHQLNSGTTDTVLSKRSGNSKVSVTTDIYGHVVDRANAEAAERLEELLTPVAVKVMPSLWKWVYPPYMAVLEVR